VRRGSAHAEWTSAAVVGEVVAAGTKQTRKKAGRSGDPACLQGKLFVLVVCLAAKASP
jgi:hypothetical protein